ncbi:MAG: tyrosine-protein phosphatase [Bacteroidales bacterium]|nr:tyrosine-protein phosphatase [Bacteroidales bacterium]
MMKRFLSLLLILPMLAYCSNQEPQPDPEKENKEQNQENPNPEPEPEPEEDIYAKAWAELISGTEVQATNPIAEKFVNEVTYPDHTYNDYTKILEYYGGFNGKAYNENGEEDPNGTVVTWSNYSKKGVWPDGDRPMRYSIRWAKTDLVDGSAMTLKLEDNKGWKGEMPIVAGAYYINFSNLVPGRQYTYSVTADDNGKVIKQGNFTTKASSTLHQVAFSGACRNGRDLGGWKTLDGKTVKYHMLYRGGRMQGETVNSTGKNEIRMEGIGAQLDLRNSDRLKNPVNKELAFLAPGIEEGGKWMLTNGNENGNFGKQCFEFVVNCLRENKPVYFHCSLGRDRTGTLDILLLGLLGVPEGQIGVAYEVTYFAPVGYSVSSSEKSGNPEPIFKNTRMAWAYADVVPYFWGLADTQEPEGFAHGVEKYLLDVAGVSQKDIDDFRKMMLE